MDDFPRSTDELLPLLKTLSGEPYLQALIVVVVGLLLAKLSHLLLSVLFGRLTAWTHNSLDNIIVERAKDPLFYTIVLLAVMVASTLILSESSTALLFPAIKSLIVLLWSLYLMQLSRVVLVRLSAHPDRFKAVSAQTLPLFQNLLLLLVIGLATYQVMTIWQIDMTAWLASAGIIGLAVGFAAKDTLANLFAGVFILADAPYKIGDYVVLDSGERGEVTHIGIRSTRILTRDDVEITIPNAIMGNTKVTNETGGPHSKNRIRVKIGVAYGSDIEQVKGLLLAIASEDEGVCADPEPRVRFRQFGASGLDLELLCWIDEPMLRGRVIDSLNTAIYNRFNAEGIEIPYAKQDLYIKSMPASLHDGH